MIDIFDQRIDEGRVRFRIAQAQRNALNPAVAADIAGTPATTQAKTSEKDAIGPLEAQALLQIAAVKRMVRDDQTSNGVHKLPPFVIHGGA